MFGIELLPMGMFDSVSAHEDIDCEFADNPDTCAFCYGVLRNLRSQKLYERGLVDAIVQPWRDTYDIYDAYYFARVHDWITSGQLAAIALPIDAFPGNDRDVRSNNEALARLSDHDIYLDGRPARVRGRFWGGQGKCDGSFETLTPLRMNIHGPCEPNCGIRRIEVPPGQYPLEVGFTRAGTTFEHLSLRRGVARWAYGSDSVVLLAMVSSTGV